MPVIKPLGNTMKKSILGIVALFVFAFSVPALSSGYVEPVYAVSSVDGHAGSASAVTSDVTAMSSVVIARTSYQSKRLITAKMITSTSVKRKSIKMANMTTNCSGCHSSAKMDYG